MTLLKDEQHPLMKLCAEALGLPSLWGWKPSHKPDSFFTPLVVRLSDTQVAVGYIADNGPSDVNYWEEYENGTFKEFRSQTERDDFLEQEIAEGRHPILVEKYEHGLVHYSPINTAPYPDRQWDVSPCAVYVVPEDVPEERRIQYAKDTLQEYSDWCNGQVYGTVIETLTVDRKTCQVIEEDDDTCWEIIGIDQAKSQLTDDMPKPAAAEPEPA